MTAVVQPATMDRAAAESDPRQRAYARSRQLWGGVVLPALEVRRQTMEAMHAQRRREAEEAAEEERRQAAAPPAPPAPEPRRAPRLPRVASDYP